MKKIVMFHPWIKSQGGGEQVVLELLEKSKHKIILYTWFYDKENTFPGFKKYNIRTLIPHNVAKFFSRKHILRGFLFPLGLLQKISLKGADLFLISTSGQSEFISFRNVLKGKTIAYVHTPLREANKSIMKWNLEHRYQKKFFRRTLYLLATSIYRFFEKRAWRNLDALIFNSQLSKKRAEENNLIKSKIIDVIHPPVNLSKFENKRSGNYFVYYTRINIPKRQDVLLKAWKIFSEKHPQIKLKIIGTLDNKDYFKRILRLAKKTKNVEIRINVDTPELKKIVSKAFALIFLGYSEDFGITPLEMISSGKPLIAVDEGGYVDLIKNHPEFYKIKEKHSGRRMVKEVTKSLEAFMKSKKVKRKKISVNTGNFVKEMDLFLDKV